MNPPDLEALKAKDQDAWDAAHKWLWPVAIAVAKLKLQAYLPEDAEDVAIEALEELVKEIPKVNGVEELKPLVAGIARNVALSYLREWFAKKRGGGKTQPIQDDSEDCTDPADDPLVAVTRKELADLLRETLKQLKPPLGEILSDFYLEEMKYEEIARRHEIAGGVGVYLRRGLEALRRIWRKVD